jgi:hypothetical protein
LKKKTRFAKSFYDARCLPRPQGELWPTTVEELYACVSNGHDEPLVPLGSGQHVRASVLPENFSVIRTEKLNQLLTLDEFSGTVTVQCGIKWGDLQTNLAERGWSVGRYRLYPTQATIGGLVARRLATSPSLYAGDIRNHCISLRAVCPSTGPYHYLASPRKASGPDFRYLFCGGQSSYGVIGELTLVISRPGPRRLLVWTKRSVSEAVEIVCGLYDLGVRPTWTHYVQKSGVLRLALTGPEASLAAMIDLAASLDPKLEVCDETELDSVRKKLEDQHPDRRSTKRAKHITKMGIPIHRLAATADSLSQSHGATLQIPHWSRHRVDAFVYSAGPNEFSPDLNLEYRYPLIDSLDEVTWPDHGMAIKAGLDPDGRLGIGSRHAATGRR